MHGLIAKVQKMFLHTGLTPPCNQDKKISVCMLQFLASSPCIRRTEVPTYAQLQKPQNMTEIPTTNFWRRILHDQVRTWTYMWRTAKQPGNLTDMTNNNYWKMPNQASTSYAKWRFSALSCKPTATKPHTTPKTTLRGFSTCSETWVGNRADFRH